MGNWNSAGHFPSNVYFLSFLLSPCQLSDSVELLVAVLFRL